MGVLGRLLDRDRDREPGVVLLEKPADYPIQLFALLENQVTGAGALLWRELVGIQQLGVAIDDGQRCAQVVTKRQQISLS